MDNLGIAASNIAKIKTSLKNLVENQMMPGDLVSIVTTSGGMGALQHFTSDTRQLYAAIERIRWFPGRVGDGPFGAIADGDSITSHDMQRINRQVAVLNLERAHLVAENTIESVRYVIHGMRELPGRKALVLISEGFLTSPDEFASLAAEVNSAGVVLNTVDALGIASTGLTAADNLVARNALRVSNQHAPYVPVAKAGAYQFRVAYAMWTRARQDRPVRLSISRISTSDALPCPVWN